MNESQFMSLYLQAKIIAEPYHASDKTIAGQVASALLTRDGVLYTGVSVNTPCGIGFCSEHAAVAAMLKDRKAVIHAIVSVDSDGCVMTPCGRCRQLMLFLHRDNQNTDIYLDETGTSEKLSKLMPYFKGAK
jgi:cytidine deaminase